MVAKTRRYCEDGHIYDADPFKPCCPKAGKSRQGEHNRRKAHCPQGHRYTKTNTYYWQGRRRCRSCISKRKQPPRVPSRVRSFIKLRDKGRCRYCGEQGSGIDHVVARCNEGTENAFDNMVWCCKGCNDIKGREAGFTMRSGRLYWQGRLVEQGKLFGPELLAEIRAQREARQVNQGLHTLVDFKRRGGTT